MVRAGAPGVSRAEEGASGAWAPSGPEASHRPEPPSGLTEKGPGDYVTDVDHASEVAIQEVLVRGAPEIPVLAEEAGGARAERYWAVDPLDGTTNFVHGFPVVAVSVALIQEDRPVVGAVRSPFLGETYAGARGLGARLVPDGGAARALRVAERSVERAVVATGFPFRDKRLLPRYAAAFERALERFEDLRRPGAAALDLAWVAAGVFDGFFELGLSTWDVAAGAVLIEEAGGTVTDWEGGAGYLAGDVLAGPPPVHEQLLRIAGSSGSHSS